MSKSMTANRAQPMAAASDMEPNDGLAEIELQKLQRQYRIMEGDRKAYSEESRMLISKQRETIEKLKRENRSLSDEVRLLEQRNEERRKNGIQSKKAEMMAEQAETFQKKIKTIMAEVALLDNQIGLLDRDIEQERADLGGVNAAMQNSDAIEKQIRVLENRLDKALVKFNKSLAVNKRFRSTIDNLRRERVVFDNIYRKFEKELNDQKKQMADIIELSNAAYEARDEAQARIILLREKAEKEYQTYFQEIKELDRALEQDRKLKDFMATKVLDRQEKAEGKDGANKDLSSHHEKDSSNKNMPSTEVLAESVETYERAFEEIRKVTGSSDIGELVQRFKAIEDQNFSLFNYVNEINNEVECCAEDIVKIQNHIDEMKIENVKTEESRKKLMKSLEEQLSHTNSRCSQYESQYNEVTFLISDLRKAVEGLIFNLQHTRLPSMSPRKPAQSSSQNSTHPTTPAHPSLSSGGLDETAEGAESHEAKDEDGHESSEEYNSSSREALSKAATDSGEEQNAEADQAEQERKVDYVISADMIPGGVVTDTNLLQVLGIVEQKTNELLTMHYIFNAPKKSGSSAPSGSAGVEDKGELGKEGVVITTGGVGGLLGLGPQPTVNNLSIMAPTIGDDQYSDDNMSEDDDRPMTRDELMQKTMKGLSKREKNAGVKIGGGKNKRKGPKTKALE